MSVWLIWCTFTGAVLGIGFPAQAVAILSALAMFVGFVAHLHHGIGEALLAAVAGLMVLQLTFVLAALSRAALRGPVGRARAGAAQTQP